jgi:sporulation integral membrane protein YlbJ
MLKKISFIDIVLVLLLFVLLAYPSNCINGAKSGLLLWFNVVIPTLFPFIILSYIIIHSKLIDQFNQIASPLFSRLFSLPGYALYALILGSISGYPMGAKATVDLVEQKKISPREAEFVLSFSNNPSPMFVIGFVATKLLNNESIGLLLLVSIYMGNLVTAFLTKSLYLKPQDRSYSHKKNRRSPSIVMAPKPPITFAYLDDCIASAASILVKVGGYIVIFSIPSALLLSTLNNAPLVNILASTLELSNGVFLLSNLLYPEIMKYALLCALCAFGSFSVTCQTISIIKASHLSIKKYFLSKLMNMSLTFLITYILCYLIL